MVDIIAGDGDTTDIVAGPGDRVFVGAGVEFLARITGTVGPVEVSIDGTVRTDDIHEGFPNPLYPAVDLSGDDMSVLISATGVVDAENGVWVSGEGFDVTNHGTIQNGVTNWQTTLQSVAVNIEGRTGTFENTGDIGRNVEEFQFGVGFFGDFDATAEISAVNSGAIRGFISAVFMDVAGLTFENSGTIVGEVFAVLMASENSTLINTGVIREVDRVDLDTGPGVSVVIDGEAAGSALLNHGKMVGGVRISVNDVTVTNSGSIRSDSCGVVLELFGGDPVLSGFVLENSGRIVVTGSDTPEAAVFAGANQSVVRNGGDIIGVAGGVSMIGDDNTVTNDGRIVGFNAVTISGDRGTLLNTGTIESDNLDTNVPGAAVIFQGLGVEVDNRGSMLGTIAGVGSDAVIRNRAEATIEAEVNGITITEILEGVRNTNLDIRNFGQIEVTTAAIGESFGIEVVADDSLIVNTGSIAGADFGVWFEGDDNRLVNRGTIETTTSTNFSEDIGVLMQGDDVRFINSGRITSEDQVVAIVGDGAVVRNEASGVIDGVENGAGFSRGLSLAGNEIRVTNDGIIRGEYAGVVLFGEDSGLELRTGIQVVNRGTIEHTGVDGVPDEGWAVHIDAADSVIENHGTIRGAFIGASMIGDNTKITNSGVIEHTNPDLEGAAVAMAGAGIVFRNEGEVIGDVLLVEYFDRNGATYDGRGGSVLGVIELSSGADVAIGSDEVDVIRGRAGKDDISGGRGADELDGGDGRDFLTGGKGADMLTGGNGRDVFVITERNGADEVLDFTVGSDDLDLRVLGDLSVAQISAALSDTAEGALLDLGALGGKGSVLLADVEVADLDAGDFLFL